MTVAQLIEKYRTLDNNALFIILNNVADYTPEARQAAESVIDERGGKQKITNDFLFHQKKEEEKKSLKLEIIRLAANGKSEEEISNQLKCEYLSSEEFSVHLNAVLGMLNAEKANVEIKNKTIGGCVLGGIIGFVITSGLFFIWLKNTDSIPLFAIAGFIIPCYFIIYAFTKQTYKNPLVLVFSLLSGILGAATGLFLSRLF